MRVAFGELARVGIRAQHGSDLAAGPNAARVHYAGCLIAGPTPMAFPRFLPELPTETSAFEVELPVDPKVQQALERELERQAVSVEQLLTHAVFLYLAGLDRALENQPVDVLPEFGLSAMSTAVDI